MKMITTKISELRTTETLKSTFYMLDFFNVQKRLKKTNSSFAVYKRTIEIFMMLLIDKFVLEGFQFILPYNLGIIKIITKEVGASFNGDGTLNAAKTGYYRDIPKMMEHKKLTGERGMVFFN